MKKDVILAVLITFCLTVTLFSLVPSKSATGDYDPWADINDDGTIDIKDISYVARLFGTNGEAINKTALLLELQSKIMDLEGRVALLETLHNLPLNWSDGLVGYWKFDEGSGTVAFDSSKNNNHGILVNDPLWVSGKYGAALDFDGIDDFVWIETNFLTFSNAVSVECWIKVKGSTGDHQTFLAHSYGGTHSYCLEFQPDGHTVQFALHTGGSCFAVSNVTVPFGEWTHLVGTYDGSTVCIYVNGNLSGQNPQTGSLDLVNKPLQFGSHDPAVVGDRNWFNGTIDNVMIYNRSLTAEEIALHYLLPPP
jgi:hypothetical protein